MVFSRLLGLGGLVLMLAGAGIELLQSRKQSNGNVAKSGDLRGAGDPVKHERPAGEQSDGVRGVNALPPEPPAPAPAAAVTEGK